MLQRYKINGRNAIFDLLFLNLLTVFDEQNNSVSFVDKSPCLLVYMGFYVYLAVG